MWAERKKLKRKLVYVRCVLEFVLYYVLFVDVLLMYKDV